ncbi:MAG: hypothetical protein K2P86_04310 [Xanthobacteraceae bacterium]|nr:hypothetical protein [Xanthobacteraceae bacterium]
MGLIWDCILYVSRSAYGLASFLFAAAGVAKDGFGVTAIPLPGWVWWLSAVVALFAVAVHQQHRLLTSPQLSRLRSQFFMTFGEIADAVAASNPAYSRDDIMERLLKAMWEKEFESVWGYSRMRVTRLNDAGGVVDRPLIQRRDILNVLLNDYPNQDVVAMLEAAQFRLITKQSASGQPSRFVDSWANVFTIERSDFNRWHRRLLNGKYEASH